MLVQVVKMQRQEVARRRCLQSLDRHEEGGFRGEVDGLLEARDEVGEGHVLAVARQVSVVGEGIQHGTRAAAVRRGGGLPRVVDGSSLLLACEGLYDGDGAVKHLAEEGQHLEGEGRHCRRRVGAKSEGVRSVDDRVQDACVRCLIGCSRLSRREGGGPDGVAPDVR